MSRKQGSNKADAITTDAAKAAETANTAVKIREWWSCADHGLIVVRLADTRYGLLKVRLGRAFDERGDWYELDAIGNGDGCSKDGGYARYRAQQFALPEGLRKHILREAISMAMTEIADSLAENRDEIPEFCAYVSAEGMKAGGAHAEEIEDFADGLMGCDLGDDESEEIGTVPNLRRLAGACRQLWGSGRDIEQVPSTHGFE